MKQFTDRMRGILPEGEIPLFVEALEKLQAKPRKSLRLNRLARGWTRERLEAAGIRFEARVPWNDDGFFYETASLDRPANHPLIAAGVFFIQEAGAMEPVRALDVRSGQKVLDLCAAPGAKSTQIGEYLEGRGWLVSNDPNRDRARVLDALLSRHGIANSTVHNLETKDMAEIYPAAFDRILVDAPCSGESLFAKRKEKRFDISNKEVERCALRQSNILKHAARMAAPGARLVYSTCTYAREENEDVVRAFLASQPEFRLESETRRMPHTDGVPGGYFAVLTRSTEGERLEMATRLPSHGLIRRGIVRWNGATDLFAVALDRTGTAGEWTGGRFDFDRAQEEGARRFLSGNFAALPSKAEEGARLLVAYDGETIGGAVFEKNRWKNLLPPALRFMK